MFGSLWTGLFILHGFNPVTYLEVVFIPCPIISLQGVASRCHNTHTLPVQTYRVQNTWCQQQFVFDIWYTWRVVGVVGTKYILLLDIGIASAVVNVSIYLPLPL